MNNICKFVLSNPFSDSAHIINFVYEANPDNKAEPILNTVCRICYVTDGTAMVNCGRMKAEVKKGDVFFVFPAEVFSVNGDENFRYMYISFLGTRFNSELEKLNINSGNFHFSDVEDISEVWKGILSLKTDVVDLICEGVVFYTLAKIADMYSSFNEDTDISVLPDKATSVKKYIDDNFKNADISLAKISEVFSYSSQHISKLFKEQYKIGINEYISTMRINFACLLIDKKYTNVTEIAYASGFCDALYFSKVFKRRIGMSPKQYMKEKK